MGDNYNKLLETIASDVVSIKVTQAEMKKDVERNADDLKEHMRRTDVLEKLHEENQNRISKLEEPSKAISIITGWIITVGSLVGAIYGILKLYQMLN